MRKFIRLRKLFGADGAIPIGRTKFSADYVYHPGGDEFVPGTDGVRRLHLVRLGERSLAAEEEDVIALLEALAAQGKQEAIP